jgi:hypothetical protein
MGKICDRFTRKIIKEKRKLLPVYAVMRNKMKPN